MPKKSKLTLKNLTVESFITKPNTINGGCGTYACQTQDPNICPNQTLYLICGTGKTHFFCIESVDNICIPESRGGTDCFEV